MFNEKFVYLILTIILFLIWVVIFLSRRDLTRKILTVSLIGGLTGLIAEFWYFKDYWQPPTVFAQINVPLEDFLFGFAISGIAATVFDVIFHKKDRRYHKNERKRLFILIFICGLITMLILNSWLGFNSMIVSCIIFLFSALYMISQRKDLVVPLVMTSVVLVLLVLPIYYILFNYLSPNYWNNYWLLHTTPLGIYILGNIPLTELIWYLTFGCVGGIDYEFIYGDTIVDRS